MFNLTERSIVFHFRGIPYVSRDRDIRMHAIGDFFDANAQYDVISLQEVWTEHDYQLLRKAAEKNLPFSHYFYRYELALFIGHSVTDVLFQMVLFP